MNSNRLSWKWLRGLTDDQLRKVYEAQMKSDEYLNYGDADQVDRDLRRIRDVLEERGLVADG